MSSPISQTTAPTAFMRSNRWEIGGYGPVLISFPDPLPLADLAELEEVISCWMKGLRRRSELAAATDRPVQKSAEDVGDAEPT